jgi:WD40 repeat protein
MWLYSCKKVIRLLITFSLLLFSLTFTTSSEPVQAQGNLKLIEHAGTRFSTEARQVDVTGEIAYIHDSDIYLLDLTTGDKRPLTDDRPLSTDTDIFAYYNQLAWTPDGEWLAFASNRYGNFDIFMVRADGSEEKQVTDSLVDEYLPAFAPNGTFFFSREILDETSPFSRRIFVRKENLNTEDEDIVHEIDPAPIRPIHMSARSYDEIALSMCGGSGCDIELWQFNTLESATQSRVSSFAASPFGNSPQNGSWSQSRSKLAFSAFEGSATEIQVLDPATERVETLFSLENNTINALDWSADDQWLVFGQGTPDFEPIGLWVIPSGGGEPQQISDEGSNPVWRPVVALEPTAIPITTDTPKPTLTPNPTDTPEPTDAPVEIAETTTTPSASFPLVIGSVGAIVFMMMVVLIWMRHSSNKSQR